MKYTLTLSRWHKVAERINAVLTLRVAGFSPFFSPSAA